MTAWLDAEQAGERVHRSAWTMRRWATLGRVPAHRVGGSWLFDPDELDRWVRSGSNGYRPVRPVPAPTTQAAHRALADVNADDFEINFGKHDVPAPASPADARGTTERGGRTSAART